VQLRPRPHGGRAPAGTRRGAGRGQLKRRSETTEFEDYSNQFIEATLIKSLFPQDAVRRRFLRAVGKGTAMAAIASVLPVASLQAMAQEKRSLEKPTSRSASSPSPAPRP